MTTYRLFPATNGPSSPVSYSGNFLCGVLFKVTSGGMWFTGYWKWVATGGDTTARKFALWTIKGAGSGVLLPAATVTSGTLTAGQWNFVALPGPVPLAIGTAYNACTGWTAVHGFEDSDTSGAGTGAADSFGTGGHTAGITNGLLSAYSDQPGIGTRGEPYGTPQGVFSTAGTDPSVTMPAAGSNSGNFWMDVQVSDTGPAGFAGPYRLWPGKADTNSLTTTDSPVNYDIATEFALSTSCALTKVWYFSPPGTAQLATAANIWSITGGGLTGTLAASNTSPSWSGAAASGWVSCSFSGVVLPAGKYKVSVYNSAATPDNWGAKDANTDYWRNGEGGNGITWGPLSAPNLAGASLAYNYNGSFGGSTPPFTDGTTLAGQPTFTQGPPDRYPYLYAPVASPTAGSTQNYWIDVEVLNATNAPAGIATGAGTAPGVPFTVVAPARLAPGTGTARSTAFAYAPAGLAAGTGVAQQPRVSGPAMLTALTVSPTRLTMAAAGNARTLAAPGGTGPANATITAAGGTQRTLTVAPTTGEGGP